MLENIVFDETLENLKYKLKICSAGTNTTALVFQVEICIIHNIFEFKSFWYSNEKIQFLQCAPSVYTPVCLWLLEQFYQIPHNWNLHSLQITFAECFQRSSKYIWLHNLAC